MKKIGLVTFNDAFNYGAFLQEYALQKFLQTKGYYIEVIDYSNKEFVQLYKYANNPLMRRGLKNKAKIIYNICFRPKTYIERLKKNKMFYACNRDEITFSKKYEDIAECIENQYNCFISGSDQVWNVRMTCYNMYYFLDFVKNSKKKISYAASFGRTNFSDSDYELFSEYLGTFNSVLVRENSGKKMLAEECNIDANVVLDPTFLLTANEWKNFALKASIKSEQKKYILLYVVSQPTNMYRAAINYAQEHNYDIVLLGRNSDIKVGNKILKASVAVGPYEFIKYIVNAEAVFTTSFHGTILSINLQKSFFYELSQEKYNNNARLEDITKLFKLQDREITGENVKDKEIDWERVKKELEFQRIQSESLLINAIESVSDKI